VVHEPDNEDETSTLFYRHQHQYTRDTVPLGER